MHAGYAHIIPQHIEVRWNTWAVDYFGCYLFNWVIAPVQAHENVGIKIHALTHRLLGQQVDSRVQWIEPVAAHGILDRE